METARSPEINDPPARWVSTEWLAEHQNDRNLMIIDCRPNVHDYFSCHIPGAVHVPEGLFRVHTGNIPVRWIPQDMAEALFGVLGIQRGREVVVYTGGSGIPTYSAGDGFAAAFVAYSLSRYGHTRVCILDGGLGKWQQENRPVTPVSGWARRVAFTAHIREDYFIGYPELFSLKDQPGVVLIDTRPQSAYEGQASWSQPGHIPGAVNIPAQVLMDEKNTALIKSPEDLREIFASRGVTPDKTVICSCGTGRTATLVFLILKWYLSYPRVVMYEGGFTEWISYPENPVEVGKTEIIGS
jgi:thiosulfate/3-mercaptopyruvate sulfurtransferase